MLGEIVQNLPTEILENVFSYLSAKDLWRCLAVCRRWRLIANSDRFWQKHCQRFQICEEAVSNLLDENPLCGWGTAFFQCYGVPILNWRRGTWTPIDIQLRDEKHIQYWSGREGYIYYQTSGRVLVYKVNDDNNLDLVDHLNVEIINQDDMKMFQTFCTNTRYLAVCNYNTVLIFQKIEGHFRPTNCLVSTTDEIISSNDKDNFDSFIFANFSKSNNIKVTHFLGDNVWLYNPLTRNFTIYDLFSNFIKFKLDFRFLITRPETPFLLSLERNKKMQIFNHNCEIVLEVNDDSISDVSFNRDILVANKLNLTSARSIFRCLQSWDLKTGKELTVITCVSARDFQLHPITSQVVVFEVKNNLHYISCLCARTEVFYWKIVEPIELTWYPELRIVMYEFVLIWPSCNDNDKFTLYDLKTGKCLIEKRKPDSNVCHLTNYMWVFETVKGITINSFLGR